MNISLRGGLLAIGLFGGITVPAAASDAVTSKTAHDCRLVGGKLVCLHAPLNHKCHIEVNGIVCVPIR